METIVQIQADEANRARKSLQAAAATPEFYKKLLDQMSDGVYVMDRQQRVSYWSRGAERLTGYSAQEMTGSLCTDRALCHADPERASALCAGQCPLQACLRENARVEADAFLQNKMGRRVPVKLRTQPLLNAVDEVIGVVGIFSDASGEHEMRRRLEAMRRMAFLDHLTELPNRRFLEMTLQALIQDATAEREPFGVLMIDLDDFKEINDVCGHSHGDRALQELGRILAGALRPSDTMGRWGGDEFLAIVYCLDETTLRQMAERCVALVEDTLLAGNNRAFSLSISVGATLARTDDTMQSLLERADRLMYRSKSEGRGRATMK